MDNVLLFIDDSEIDIFEISDLAIKMQLPIAKLQPTLESLVRRGLLSRIEKGKYCRHNFRNEFVIANYLVSDGVVAYWSALNLHGLTEQIPNTVFVQTTKQKKHKTVFGVRYQFIKVKPEKMTGIIKEGYGNHQYRITDREKTLIDCFELPSYSGGFAELLRAFNEADVNASKLVRYGEALNNVSVIKRLAYLIEVLAKPNMEEFIAYAESRVNDKYNLFDAHGADKGDFNRKWRLRLNISEESIRNIANKMY